MKKLINLPGSETEFSGVVGSIALPKAYHSDYDQGHVIKEFEHAYFFDR